MRTLVPLMLAMALTVGAGCKSDADKLTLDGVDALKDCDIRTAHDKFAEAWAEDREHPQAALGFALTDAALLPEDPIVTGVLARIGFTRAIDMQVLMFGPDGLMARAARGDTCEQIDAFVNTNVPYAPLADPVIDEVALIDPAFTGTDIARAARDLSPRLDEIASALEIAAGGMAEPVLIEGGCGLGTVRLQAPELYVAAALIRGVLAAIELGQVYDWALPIRTTLELGRGSNAQAYADLLNAHVGRVIDPAGAPSANSSTGRGLDLLVRAIDAAQAADAVPDGLFDWTAFPDTLLDDLRRMVVAVRAALDGQVTLPDVTPTLTLDGRKIFAAPIDFQKFPEPLYRVDGIAPDLYVTFNETTFGDGIETLFMPNPVPAYAWGPEDAWNAFDTTPVTMPSKRFEMIYTCMSTPP